MALWILRSVFLLVAAGVGVTLVNSPYLLRGADLWLSWLAFLMVLVAACGAITIDIFTPRKRIDVISAVYFGIMVGVFLTYVAGVAFTPLLNSVTANLKMTKEGSEAIGAFVQLLLATILCYACISLLLQTKDDFRFIIPYVEFAREVKGLKPYLLDTSVVIDGRIADVIETGVLDNQLIMPRFILAELQAIADSHDKLKRTRGRRGLDVLNRLRNNENIDLKMVDQEFPEMVGQPVDMKLVLLARRLDGKVVTGDYNLNKVAKLHNVNVVNLNELANCLKPVYLPGERFTVKVVKNGEEYNQGIGYLDDGTMIVVENGREHVGEAIEVEVTSVLQKSAGRMIFSRADANAKSA